MNPTSIHSAELTPRLIPLFDGRPGIRGTLHVEICEPRTIPCSSPAAEVANDSQAVGNSTDSEAGRKAEPRCPGGAQDPESSIQNPAPRPSSLEKTGPSTINSNDHQPILDFISSDDSLDRFGEIIVASGWRLENYRRNPVFQNAHQYGDVIFTLGRALITEIRQNDASFSSSSSSSRSSGACLFQRIQFATDINPMARIAYGLYQGKFLNAVSVGFVPMRWENGGPKDTFRRKYLEQELLEVSAVAIPANPNALALGLKAGAIQRADLREASDLLRLALEPLQAREAHELRAHTATDLREYGGAGESRADGDEANDLSPSSLPRQFCGAPAGSNTDTRALGLRAFEAQLLHLARALKEALRR